MMRGRAATIRLGTMVEDVRTALSRAAATAIAEAEHVAAADVFAHAINIDTGAQVGIHSDEGVVTASVFKVPVLTAYVRSVAAGQLDPMARLTISAGSGTRGGTGLSVFSDDAEWSLRDVATSMITVSDNAATDIVMGMVGLEPINRAMADLGLDRTVLVADCAALFTSMADDLGIADLDCVEEVLAAEPSRAESLAVCTASQTNRSTPRESTRLLQLLWTDRAAPPVGCAEARRILGLQVWPHRLTAGFPRDDLVISGKTGTIGVVRNEVGVVEFPDGGRFAVAVFTRSRRYALRQPAIDALIGSTAATLVSELLPGADTG